MIVGNKRDFRCLDISSLHIGEETITVKKAIKDLGVIIDCSLSLEEQISQVVKTAGYHLSNISFVKKYLVIRP